MVKTLNVDLLVPAKVTVTHLKTSKVLFTFDYKKAGFYAIDTSAFPTGQYLVSLKAVNEDKSYHLNNIVIFSNPS